MKDGKIFCESINKIRQNKDKIEKALNVKISISGKNVSIDGDSLDEYVASQVLEALDLGFTTDEALLLAEEDCILEKINIKDLTKRHDLPRIRARIIGTKGKTKEIIENLSDCAVCLKDNCVGIIGTADNIKKTIKAIISIIQGSKQSKVYAYLERERAKEKIKLSEDLGLKRKP